MYINKNGMWKYVLSSKKEGAVGSKDQKGGDKEEQVLWDHTFWILQELR